MKVLGRTLIILFAAGVIAGATYGLSNAGVLDGLIGGGEMGGERPEGDFESGEMPEMGEMPEGGAPGEGGMEGGLNFREVLESLKTIGIIGVVVILLSLGWDQVRKIQKRSTLKRAGAS